MDNEKVKIFSGGLYEGDVSKFTPIPRSETVLTNEQQAEWLSALIDGEVMRTIKRTFVEIERHIKDAERLPNA